MRGFDWAGLWRPTWPPWEVALRAALIYGFIQLLIRLTGRKELGRFSMQDIVVLFLISTAARQSIVGSDTSLTSAFVGLATLIFLDRLLDSLAFWFPRFGRLLAGPPRHLIKDGQLQDRMLWKTRISREELVSQLRSKGRDDLSEVRDAYLEPDGRITFIFRDRRA